MLKLDFERKIGAIFTLIFDGRIGMKFSSDELIPFSEAADDDKTSGFCDLQQQRDERQDRHQKRSNTRAKR